MVSGNCNSELGPIYLPASASLHYREGVSCNIHFATLPTACRRRCRVVHLRYMARIIIPKTLAGSDDLVIIPKKEFDDLSARAESAVGAHFDDYLARRLLGIAGLARRIG